jgi:hypothetical protein
MIEEGVGILYPFRKTDQYHLKNCREYHHRPYNECTRNAFNPAKETRVIRNASFIRDGVCPV